MRSRITVALLVLLIALIGAPGPDSAAAVFIIKGASFPVTIIGSGAIAGTSGNDHLEDYCGNDTFSGGPGDDRINGLDGGDSLNGGFGDDQLRGEIDDDIRNGGDDAYSVDGTCETTISVP
jgi:Ca2+-binding RTX toxin-like protein